jgi:hypothetical protein
MVLLLPRLVVRRSAHKLSSHHRVLYPAVSRSALACNGLSRRNFGGKRLAPQYKHHRSYVHSLCGSTCYIRPPYESTRHCHRGHHVVQARRTPICGCRFAAKLRGPISAANVTQIGINLGDPVFRGHYHGTQRHEDDFNDVLQRALDAGCKKFMVTGSDLKESQHAVEIAKAHRKKG